MSHDAVAKGHLAKVDPKSENRLREQGEFGRNIIGEVAPGTLLCVWDVDPKEVKKDGQTYIFWKVRVLDGDFEGKDGWMAEFWYPGGEKTRMMFGKETRCGIPPKE